MATRKPGKRPTRKPDSLEHYHTLFEHAADGVYLQTLKGTILDINPAGAHMLGYEPEELLGREAADIVTPAIRKNFPAIEKHLLEQKAMTFEAENLHKDGTILPVELSLSLVEGAAEPLVVAIVRDISRRRQVEEALRESEEKYRSLVEESIPGIVIGQGIPPKTAFANHALAGIVGHSLEELLNLTGEEILGLVHPEDRDIFLQRFKDRLAGKPLSRPYTFRALHRDGSIRWVDIRSKRIQYKGEAAVHAAFLDVTDRVESQEALRASEEKYRTLMENVLDGLYTLDREGRFTYVNDVILERSGQTREWFLEKTYLDVILPEHHERTRRNFEAVMRGETVPIYEVAYPSASGESLYVEINTTPIRQGEDIVGLLGVSRSITERRQAAEALRRSEETARAFLNATKDLAAMVDTEGRVIAVNEAMACALDGGPEELIGERVYDFFPPEVARARREIAAEVIRSGKLADYEEARGERWLANRVHPLFNQDGKVDRLVVFSTDITRRKHAEAEREHLLERIHRAEKHEAIAILAGGIAQSFRDVLMTITGSATLLKRQTSGQDELAAGIDRIETGCACLSNLVDQLYSYGRGIFPDPKRIRPNECMQQAIAGLADRLPAGARITTNLARDVRAIQVDPGSITTVFANVLSNAVEAMKDGGDIRVRTANVSRVPSSPVAQPGMARGPHVHISIADTGCGMSPEVLARVFDPYFSTKGHPARGVGMAVASAVIQHYAGVIFLDSEEGRGTSVHMYLPAEGDPDPSEDTI